VISSDLVRALRAFPGRTPAEPVPAHRLVAFEATHGVALPAPYRVLLTEVGDGFDVPGFPQVFSLARVEQTIAAEGQRPAGTFPYDEASIAAMSAVIARGGDLYAALRPHLHIGALDGCVPIADGSDDTVVLVVTGPLRGRLFRNGDNDYHESAHLYDFAGDLRPLEFEPWLRLWVETMIGPLPR
jgi:hypothetical protein